jgi:hypothetical protein
MSQKKKWTADFLFAVQIVGAFVFAGSQFFRLLETTKGQLLSMFLVMEAFLVLHIMLAVAAHHAKPSRITRQTLWVYVMWVVLLGSNIVAVFINGDYQWSENDTRTTLLALTGAALVLGFAKVRGMGFQDPMPKSFIAMLFKALPQFVMAFEVARMGGTGVPAVTIIVGNITVGLRIAQILFTILEAGWERNRFWLLASETMNEVSWAAVSVVWAFWFFAL